MSNKPDNEELEATAYSAANEDIRVDGTKPIMVWQLGSCGARWLPGAKHFDAVRKFVKRSNYENKYNVFITHYATSVTIVDTRPWYKRLWFPMDITRIGSNC